MDDLKEGRDYTISDPELSSAAAYIAQVATRDLADLTKYGISEDSIAMLVEIRTQFFNYPPDKSFLWDVEDQTALKNGVREEIHDIIRKVMVRASNAFGDKSLKFKHFGVKDLNRATDSEFVIDARYVHAKAVELLPALTAFGQTATELTTLLAKIETMNLDIIAKKDAMSERMEKGRERVALGNQLYGLVQQICIAGKEEYRNSNYAKFNDYVFYKSQVPTTPPAVPLNFHYQSGQFQWDAVENAISYQVWMHSNLDATGLEFYKGDHTEVNFLPVQPPPVGITTYFFKVRAHALAGYGEYSVELSVDANVSA